MKKLILTGLAALSLVACSGSFQKNATERETILSSKFNRDLPEWVLESADSKLIEDNGKTYFVSEIIRDEKSDNTAHLERIASLDAASQLAQMAEQNINTVIQSTEGGSNLKSASSSLKEVSSTNIRISTIVPTATYWQLVKTYEGKKVYRAYAKVRIDSQEIVDAMARAFVQANPDVDSATAKDVVNRSVVNMNLEGVTPNEKIF